MMMQTLAVVTVAVTVAGAGLVAGQSGSPEAFRETADAFISERLIYHIGDCPGTSSVISFMPERNVGMTVFVNEDEVGARLALMLTAYVYDWWVNQSGTRTRAAHRASLRSRRPHRGGEPTASGGHAGGRINPADGRSVPQRRIRNPLHKRDGSGRAEAPHR